MRCWRNAERSGPHAWRLAWPAALVALLVPFAVLGASAVDDPDRSGFRVRDASARLVDGVYRVDADIAFDFSAEALDALDNGVPITVVVEMEILRDRRVWFDETVATVEARYRIDHHALSGRYLVRNLNTDESRTFREFREMTASLGRIEDYPVLDRAVLDAGEDYSVRVRARLDIESLPSPLRPLAYLSSRWRQKSDWYEWEIEP